MDYFYLDNEVITRGPKTADVLAYLELAERAWRWPKPFSTVLDRTGTVAFPFKTVLMPELKIPKLISNPPSYNDCMMKRADELLTLARQKDVPIALLWSGGVDSTAMLVAFMSLGATRQELFVALSPTSIKNHPRFFENHIYGKFDYYSSYEWNEMISGQCVYVTGDFNDQLFGATALLVAAGSLRHKPYAETLRGFLMARGMSRSAADKWYAVLDQSTKNSPREIKTLYDMLWWMMFNFMWHEVYFRILSFAQHRQLLPSLLWSYQPFYGSDDFQRWAIQVRQNDMTDDKKSAKMVTKNFIHAFDGDDDARANKTKDMSPLPLKPHCEAIDVNLGIHDHVDPAEVYQNDTMFSK